MTNEKKETMSDGDAFRKVAADFRISKIRDHERQITALREQLENLKAVKSSFSKPIPAFDEIISTYYWRLSKAHDAQVRLMRTWDRIIEDSPSKS